MKVETYEVEEINASEASTMAADAESIELATKLGLKGQLEMCSTDALTRCPYREMTALEEVVFRTIFPETTSVFEYRREPLPLRILQVIAHAKEVPALKRLEIWHPVSQRDPDPVLVAHSKEEAWLSSNVVYLLARWGDSLKPFDTLIEKAKKVWIATHRDNLKRIASEVASHLDIIESKAESIFATGKIQTYAWHPWS